MNARVRDPERTTRRTADHSVPVWAVLLGAVAAGFSVLAYLDRASTALTHFTDRAIGVAVVMGVDAALRTAIYVRSLFLFAVVFLAVFALCSALGRWTRRLSPAAHPQIEHGAATMLAAVSLVNLVFYALSRTGTFRQTAAFTAIAAVVTLAVVVLRTVPGRGIGRALRAPFSHPAITAIAAVLSYQIVLAAAALLNRPHLSSVGFWISWAVLWLVFCGVRSALRTRGSDRAARSRFDAALAYAGIPLAVAPLIMPVANEIQFTLAGTVRFHARDIAGALTVVLIVIGLTVFLAALRKPAGRRSPGRLLGLAYFPILIAACASSACYTPDLRMGDLDFFHTGEATVPVQQWFQFGNLPYVNFYPPHGLFDMVPQVFYAGLNGFRGFDMLLWGSGHMTGWLPTIAALLLIYWLLSRLTCPLFGLLAVVALPVNRIFPLYFSFFILAAFALWRAAAAPTFRRLSVLMSALLFLFLWRVDFGIAGVTAAAVVLAGMRWNRTTPTLSTRVGKYCDIFSGDRDPSTSCPPSCGGSRQALGMTPQRLSFRAERSGVEESRARANTSPYVRARPLGDIVLSALLVFGPALAAYALVAALKGESLPALMQQNLYYAVIQAPSAAYERFLKQYDTLAVFQYLVLPAVGVVYMLYFAVQALFRRKPFTPAQWVLTFLAAVALVMSVRSLHRHTHFEGIFNPYLFVFLACLLPFHAGLLSRWAAPWGFLAVAALYGFIVTPPHFISLAQGPRHIFQFRNWRPGESRVQTAGRAQQKVIRFLDHCLADDQTFMDAANAPLLYFLAGRAHPGYILESVYHTSEPIQRRLIEKLDRYRAKGRLPLVLFKQNTAWDWADDVPNEIRAYRLTEYIYRNYRPFLNVDRFEFWADRSLSADTVLEQARLRAEPSARYPLTLRDPAAGHEIEQRPRLPPTPREGGQAAGDGLAFDCGEKDPYAVGLFDLSGLPRLDFSKRLFLKLTCRTSRSGVMQVFYAFGAPFTDFDSTQIVANPDESGRFQALYVPIPPPKNERRRLTEIRLDPPNGALFEIAAAEIIVMAPPNCGPLSSLGVSRVTDDYRQDFELHRLPYIWGTYDDLKPVSRAPVLQEFRDGLPCRLAADRVLTLAPAPDLDRSSGNYLHLRLSTRQEARITVAYGSGSETSSFVFDAVPSGRDEDYLIRVSSQWRWMSRPVSSLSILASEPVELQQARILKGD